MHVPESQIDHSDETSTVPTDDYSIEISSFREMEREEFDRVIRQLNNELANLNTAAQPLTSSGLSQSQILKKVHLHPTRHLLAVENVTILFVGTRGTTIINW